MNRELVGFCLGLGATVFVWNNFGFTPGLFVFVAYIAGVWGEQKRMKRD